jgi:hypothetical protein
MEQLGNNDGTFGYVCIETGWDGDVVVSSFFLQPEEPLWLTPVLP